MSVSTLIKKLHFTSILKFEGISKNDFEELQSKTLRLEEKKNRIIYLEGSNSKGVYLLNKGIIKIYQANKDGDDQIVYFYGPGELLGYRPLISNEPHPVTAETVEDCVISFIPQVHFLEVLNKSPELSNLLLKTLSHEFTIWVNIISTFTQQSIKENVALALLLLEEKYGRNNKKAGQVIINLPRKDFANYVGTTIETFVRILRVFKDEKIISTKGRGITILDKNRLASKLGETFIP